MKEINPTLFVTVFEKQLWSAALKNLTEVDNELRFSNFAFVARELLRHILSRLAPEEQITRCKWYKETKNDRGEVVIPRADRVGFALRGGLPNNLIASLKIKKELDGTNARMSDAVELLSKYTHIEEATFNPTQETIDKLVDQVIDAFNEIPAQIQYFKEKVKNALGNQVIQEINDAFDYDVIEEIDCLSTHHEIEQVYITDYEVENIGIDNIQLFVKGIVHVRLQYGSDSDVRRGDGLELDEKYPFVVTVEAPTAYKLKHFCINMETFRLDVNTDSFYGIEDTEEWIEKQIQESGV